MMAAWRWVSDHWWQIALGIGAIVVAIAGVSVGRNLGAGERRKAHRDVIEAGKRADLLVIEMDDERAARKIEDEHAEAVAEIERKDEAKYQRLRRDPNALARAAVRWANKSG